MREHEVYLILRRNGTELEIALTRENKPALIFRREFKEQYFDSQKEALKKLILIGTKTQILDKAQRTAQEILPPELFSTLAKVKKSSFLILDIEENLLDFPWEILGDGEGPLCMRFALGRIPCERTEIEFFLENHERNALVLVEDTGVPIECGKKILSKLKENNWSTDMYVLSAIRFPRTSAFYEILHYYGHEPAINSNLPEGLDKIKAKARLLWIDTCNSGTPEEYLLLQSRFKSEHIIGNICFVEKEKDPDKASRSECRFYRLLASGKAIGEALRIAKEENFKENDTEWAHLTLWGNPSIIYYSVKKRV